AVAIVAALAGRVVPHAPADARAPLGPVGLAGLGQREVEGAVGEVDDHQPAAVLQVFHEVLLRRLTEPRPLPVAVIEDDHVVVMQAGLGEELDVLGDRHGDAGIGGEGVLDRLRRLAPGVAGVLMPGDDDGANRPAGGDLGQFVVGGRPGLYAAFGHLGL